MATQDLATAMFHNSPIPIGVARLSDGCLVEVNQAFVKLFGYSRDEALGKNPVQLGLWTAPADYDRLVEEASCGKRVVGFATSFRRKGGELRDMRISAHVITAGPERYLAAILSDTSEVADLKNTLRLASEALKESETRFRSTFEQAAVGMAHIGLDGRWLRVNRKLCDILGYAEDELRTMTARDITHPDEVEDAVERFRQVLAGEVSTCAFEKRYRHKTGRIVWANVTTTLAFDEHGAPMYFISVAEDITERKGIEIELMSLRRKFDDMTKFDVAGHTVAALAHDLNQPLNAVSSYAEAALQLLKAGNPQPDKLRHAIEKSAQQAQRAGRVVHNLLAFLSHGEVEREVVDLNDLAHKVVKQTGANGHEGIRFSLDLSPDLAAVKANRLQIKKVLANLIDNGIEAMHQAGGVNNAITVTVRTNHEGNMAQVTVIDTGPGIDSDILHRVFDTFFTTKPNGLGVGLAISRTIVEAHGGRLWAESVPGTGACFHFTLPFAA